MKSPDKGLPQEKTAATAAGAAPDIDIKEKTAMTAQGAGSEPSLPPPAQASENDAAGAAVWQTDKRVNALYATKDARNSWMGIAGIGWVKLTTATDSACEAMTILATHARIKNCRIDYAVDGGLTTQIYIW